MTTLRRLLRITMEETLVKRCLSVAISATLVFLLANGTVGQSAKKSSTKSKAIEALFTAWNSRDSEKVVNAFTVDGVYEDVAFELGYDLQ